MKLKKALLLSILPFTGLLFQNVIAQSVLTPIGEISSAEIQLTKCSFDTEANAVILMHEAFSNYDDYYHLVTEHHIRIKILNEKGIGEGDIVIPFWSKDDFEDIVIEKAITYNFENGRRIETPVSRKDIFTNRRNDRYSTMSFAFPAVKTGSILDLKYVSTMKHYGGLDKWEFQDRLPVVSSKYDLLIRPNLEFSYVFHKRPDYKAIVKQNPSTGSIYFEMNNIPALDYEPYIDSRKDYLQHVEFQLSGLSTTSGAYGGSTSTRKYMDTWESVSRELLSTSEFGGMVGKSIPGTDEFVQKLKALSSDQAKMKMAYDFVVANMTWNHIYSKYASDGLKKPWEKKTGNSAEVNFILINLLKQAGLDVAPAVVSERWHGKVSPTYTFLDQFDNVVACVKIGDQAYYLNATERYTPAFYTPYELLNTRALVVTKKTKELTEIKNESLIYNELIVNTLTLNSDGSIKGNTNIQSAGYARVEKLQQFMDNEKTFVKNHFSDEDIIPEVTKFTTEGVNNDSSAFVQHCDFTGKLSLAGDFYFVPLNLFSGFDKNPFLRDKRFSNINFGYKRSIKIVTTVSLNDDYVVEELPKAIRLSSEEKDIEMTRAVEYNKEFKELTGVVTINFAKSLYDVDDYPVLQAFYKRMFEFIREPVLIKKK